MIPEEIKLLWDANKADFIRLYSTEQQKPITHIGLEKAFVDIYGKQIYKFPQDVALPIERLGKKKEFMQWLAKGLTDEEDKMFDNTIAEIVLNGKDLLDVKRRVAGVLAKKEERRQLVIHADIFYNLVAVELILPHEKPECFDNDLHMEKVRLFKEMTRDGSTYFFFQQTGLKSLSAFLNFTPQEWNHYWNEFLIKKKALPESLKVLVSGIISTNAARTSMNKS